MAKNQPSTYDSYITTANEFAQPILDHLRECVHLACPEVSEEFKWSFPNFTYKGKILCSMAAFKEHVAFGFWLGSIMDDPNGILVPTGESGMGNLGKITSLEDLPPKEVLIRYIQQAKELTDQGKKLPAKPKTTVTEIDIPEILKDKLEQNKIARATFDNFSNSHKREYIEWIDEAKTEATRLKRLTQTIEWLEEGKSKNWKYMKC